MSAEYWIVTLKVYAFESEVFAHQFGKMLMDAFCEIDEFNLYGCSALVEKTEGEPE